MCPIHCGKRYQSWICDVKLQSTDLISLWLAAPVIAVYGQHTLLLG